MNPIEVYKKLPQKNCGKCSAGTCMAFAVQYLRRLVPLSQCEELDEDGKKIIEDMLVSKPAPDDWKVRRLEQLIEEIKDIDFSSIAPGIGASVESDIIKFTYLGREITFSHSGSSDDIGTLGKLLAVLYIKQAGNTPLSGKWVNFRDLKGGGVKAESFRGECEQPLAELFEKDPDGTLQKLESLSLKKTDGFSADHSYIINGMPKIPMLVLLWSPDEEFGAECKVLFDTSATDYLDVESLCYLGENLAEAVE